MTWRRKGRVKRGERNQASNQIPPFEEIGLPFWVPVVLCHHSEVFFVEVAQHSNDLLMNLLGRKWSPHPIPPPPWGCPSHRFFYEVRPSFVSHHCPAQNKKYIFHLRINTFAFHVELYN